MSGCWRDEDYEEINIVDGDEEYDNINICIDELDGNLDYDGFWVIFC